MKKIETFNSAHTRTPKNGRVECYCICFSGSPDCGVSIPLDSEVFNDGSDVVHQPEQLNALYRANQRYT